MEVPDATTSGTVPVPQPMAVASSSSGVPNPMSEIDTEEMINKRTALAGQWRTPPTPFFASGGSTEEMMNYDATPGAAVKMESQQPSSQQVVVKVEPEVLPQVVVKVEPTPDEAQQPSSVQPLAPPPPPAVPISVTVPVPPAMDVPQLPHSAEDYAKALQEAYCRGAEAAARAAAQQMASVASCPELKPVLSGTDLVLSPQPPPSTLHPTTTAATLVPSSASAPALVSSTTTTTTTASAPESQQQPHLAAAPNAVASQPMQLQVQMVHHHHHHHMTGVTPLATPSLTVATALPPTVAAPSTVVPATSGATTTATTTAPATASSTKTVTATPSVNLGVAAAATTTTATSTAQQHQQRSVSLPDMSSYAVQQEEEKRQKRLARNRASARLRRLRKKNLVDAYEAEVGSLEKTIQQLQHHEWGATNNASALAEALSMDRGQQKLTSAERCQAATDILAQQLQFLQQLEDLMQEQYVLQQMASCSLSGEDHEWKDLQEMLQLTPTQCQELVQNSAGWQEEWNALQTVKASLQAMKENDWLWNEGCSAITDQFMAILHKNQISKFLLWADHNAESIEELDGVHAINTVQDSPIFQFGVDSSPSELLDDDKMTS